MTLQDPYVWIDPADAIFVASCRDALKIERRAWEAADAERRHLRERLTLALSWASEPLTAWHTDPHMGEGRHAHTWIVTAFWRSKPFRDGRSVKASLRRILDTWEGRDLPPELWAAEDLAAAVLQLHGNADVCGIKVERPGFGGCGIGEWR